MTDDQSTGSPRAVPRRDLLIKGGIAAAATGAALVVGAAPASAETLAPILWPIDPVRIYDSREESGRLGPGATRILVADQPAEDLAYLLNITVTDTIASGWLSVYSAEVPWPGTSTLNWTQNGQTIANTAYTFIRQADQGIAITVGGPGSTQFVIDVTGVLAVVDLDMANPSTAMSALGSRSRQLHEA